jgi:hypothetical protein
LAKIISAERRRPVFALFDIDISYLAMGVNRPVSDDFEARLARAPDLLRRWLEEGILEQVLGMFRSVDMAIVHRPRLEAAHLFFRREGVHPEAFCTERCWLYPDFCHPHLVPHADEVYENLYSVSTEYLERMSKILRDGGTNVSLSLRGKAI